MDFTNGYDELRSGRRLAQFGEVLRGAGVGERVGAS